MKGKDIDVASGKGERKEVKGNRKRSRKRERKKRVRRRQVEEMKKR